tara:strand:- start:5211 stop:5396 length:186 start_codon:yes stop_codon:yes gene_type:complete
LLAFSSNADVPNVLILGRDIETWLLYTLLFLGVTSIAFLWVWISGFIHEQRSGKSIQNPWD